MAHKNPSTSSSSSGDSGSFEDSSSESEPALPPPKQQPRSQPLTAAPASAAPAAPASASAAISTNSDSGSGSDSDSSDKSPASPRRPSRVADPSITPLASKPMAAAAPKHAKPSTTPTKRPPPPPQDSDDSESESESDSGPDSPEPSTNPLPPKPSDQSSPLESEEPTKKTTPAPVEESVGKSPGGQNRKRFQRIWGDADEIALFRGLVQYRTDTGSVPSSPSDMDAFLDFIHKSLQIEVSKAQLLDKVRRLRKKYTACPRGKRGSFSNPHLREMHELSQKIWGLKYASAAARHTVKGLVRNSRKRKKTSAEASDASIGRERKQGKTSDGPRSWAAIATTNGDNDSVGVKCPLMSAAVLRMAGLPHGDSMIQMALDWADEKKAMAIEREFEKVVSSEMEHNLAMMRLKVKVGEMIVNARKK